MILSIIVLNACSGGLFVASIPCNSELFTKNYVCTLIRRKNLCSVLLRVCTVGLVKYIKLLLALLNISHLNDNFIILFWHFCQSFRQSIFRLSSALWWMIMTLSPDGRRQVQVLHFLFTHTYRIKAWRYPSLTDWMESWLTFSTSKNVKKEPN